MTARHEPASVAAAAKVYGYLLEACALAAAVFVFAMMCLIVADVLQRNVMHKVTAETVRALMVFAMTSLAGAEEMLRTVLNATIAASIELTEYAMFYATAFAAPWLLRRGQHIRIDVVIARVRPVAGWVMEILCDLIGLALSLLMSWYSIQTVWRSWNGNTLIVKNLIISEWFVLWPLPVMFVLLAIEFVFRLVRLGVGPHEARREGGAV